MGNREVLWEKVLIIMQSLPQTEYTEIVEEVAVNIGNGRIDLVEGQVRTPMGPGKCVPTIYTAGGKKHGDSHGYEIEDGEGHLYIARTLLPGTRDLII